MKPLPPPLFNIKRGRKLPEASDASSFLRRNDKISPLLPTIKRNASLQKDCEAILPYIFPSCEILQLSDSHLTLATPNAAFASKLKQQLPKLQSQLQLLGWQVHSISIKVQIRNTVEKVAPVKQLVLSQQAVNAFDLLEHTLEATPQNASLRSALARLVQRNQFRK